MKNALMPRLFAAVVSVWITLALFDQVARMGESGGAQAPVVLAAVTR